MTGDRNTIVLKRLYRQQNQNEELGRILKKSLPSLGTTQGRWQSFMVAILDMVLCCVGFDFTDAAFKVNANISDRAETILNSCWCDANHPSAFAMVFRGRGVRENAEW